MGRLVDAVRGSGRLLKGGSGSERGAVLFGASLALAVALGTGALLVHQHGRALQNEERALQSLATVLAEQTDRSFQALDLVQAGLIERIQGLGIGSPDEYERGMSTAETHEFLKTKIGNLPQVDAVVLIKADGKLINSSRRWPISEGNVADRDYFKALISDRALTTFISQPIPNRSTGTWLIYNARKVTGPDGVFLGLVLGAIQLNYFEEFFERVAPSATTSIALFRRDGVLLARYPHVNPSIGKSFAPSSVFRQIVSHADRGAIRQTSRMDGQDRLIAARTLAHYPLVVTATNTVDAALAPWTEDTRYLVGITALLVLVIACVVHLRIRQIRSHELLAETRERKRSAEALEEQYRIVRRHREELEKQNLRFDVALNNMSQGLVMFDKDQTLVVCNPRYAEVYGLPPAALRPGMTQREVLELRVAHGFYAGPDPEQYVRDRVENASRRAASDSILELSDGRTIAVSHRPMPDGGWVSTHEDVTARRQAEARIAHMAHHDALTNLPNRVRFRADMERALGRVRRGEKMAVLCLDLDHFKAVNDTLGHPVGDALLKVVADRLRGGVRDTDTIARLGGDEFAIVQVGAEQPQHATALAQRLIEAISVPYDLDGHQVVVGTSVGIAVAPADGDDPNQLLKSADMALYRAKTDGRGAYRFFEPEMDARMQVRRALELDLRQALPNGEFEVHYQPLVNLADNRVSGFEALLRWIHPERGSVSPADFIPLAEEIGLINRIGAWVLRQACADAATWPGNVRVAVNVSPAQFKSRSLVLDVVSALGASGLPAHRLEIEITEALMLQDTEATLGILHQLRGLGVRISLDDFGTGYSSLSYLRKFPFDKIKIDQSFVREITRQADSVAIVRAIVGLGAGLGMSTTAEGVETREQLDRLRAEGCSEVQGWLFSPARPARDVAGLLAGVTAAA